ncbi:hypothetical protein Pcinc_006509 [Petrolisthes cinctipes]|uniref:Ionotropic glutamate receptor C-terminal domain-containing protein n=1 Tax=Petrolisthes cinctipes TaxID=88211 RepID=A0AAE1KZJ5_PETCI|nr:hypothetical protein Pcinc_006509 [Petrolisthes cinctipes]
MLLVLVRVPPSPQKRKERDSTVSRRREKHKSHLVWVIRSFAGQSNPWLPKDGRGRTVTAIWLLACLVFLALFSSTLTAMLTVPIVRVPVDSTGDLVTQRKIPWAIESGSYLYQVLYVSCLVQYYKLNALFPTAGVR